MDLHMNEGLATEGLVCRHLINGQNGTVGVNVVESVAEESGLEAGK